MSRAGSDSTRAGQGTSTGGSTAAGTGPSGLRRWIKRGFLLLGAAFGVALALFAVAYARTDIPSPNEGFDSETTIVYYADGKTVLGRFADQNRTLVELKDVPQHVQDAVIAAEDKTFYSNQGIDPKGIVRAAFNNASGGDTQGASTITQQYVKVYYLSQERTYTRKLREAILSLKIHRQLEKEEILEGYLNTIYFGRGAYGIEAAAQAYFDRPASQLTVKQGAALAAIINSPTAYDPANGKDSRQALKSRYTYVIDQMSEMATLPGSKGNVYALPPFAKPQDQNVNGGQRGHALAMVREELSKQGYSDQEISGGGLRVTTTFTQKAMEAAESGVTSVRPDLKELHAAAAVVDVKTGALRGMYAGQDYLKSQLNWAVEGGAPGSAFKPFTLATGLDYGYALDSTFYGNSPIEVDGATFENQGESAGESYGEAIPLLYATEQSVNTAYIDLADTMDNGIELILDTAVAMGIPRNAPGLDENYSMVLGSATISVIDMANSFGTIAAEGRAKDWFVGPGDQGPPGGHRVQAQGQHRGGDRPGRRGRHLLRPAAGDHQRHRHQRQRDRAPRRRQDRHGDQRRRQRALLLVRRLHPAARDRGDVRPRQRQPAARRLPADLLRRRVPGADLGRDHGRGAGGGRDPPLPATGLPRPDRRGQLPRSPRPPRRPSPRPPRPPRRRPSPTPSRCPARRRRWRRWRWRQQRQRPGQRPGQRGWRGAVTDRRPPAPRWTSPAEPVPDLDQRRVGLPGGAPRGVAAPSREDPVVRAASEVVGGPVGRRAAGATWWRPVRVVVAVACVFWVLAMLQKAPCSATDWSDGTLRARAMCYSDIPYLYAGRGFAELSVPYSDTDGRYPYLEYPVGTGYFTYGVAWVTHAVNGFPDTEARAALPTVRSGDCPRSGRRPSTTSC